MECAHCKIFRFGRNLPKQSYQVTAYHTVRKWKYVIVIGNNLGRYAVSETTYQLHITYLSHIYVKMLLAFQYISKSRQK